MEHQADIMLDTFCCLLRQISLQRHILAVSTSTHEFLQIRPSGGEETNPNVKPVKKKMEVSDFLGKLLATLMQAMQQLIEKVDQLQTRPRKAAPRKQ